jgi:hypothetical protein
MDLKKLAGFRAVAKHGNLRRAAAAQRLTLAAISIRGYIKAVLTQLRGGEVNWGIDQSKARR